jgi:general stress protein 26
MATAEELEKKFWDALDADMTMMLGIAGAEDGHLRPMTAVTEREGHGPIWFFTSTDNALVQQLGTGERRATSTFTAKGHDLFATLHGSLRVDTDRAVVDRLWNRFVAAWYEGGKDDPKLALLRLDPESAEVWLSGSSLVAGVKLLVGVDPKKSYRGNVGQVDLH